MRFPVRLLALRIAVEDLSTFGAALQRFLIVHDFTSLACIRRKEEKTIVVASDHQCSAFRTSVGRIGARSWHQESDGVVQLLA